MQQSKVQKVLWLTPIIAGGLVAGSQHVHSQATEQDYQPKVVRSDDNGRSVFIGLPGQQ